MAVALDRLSIGRLELGAPVLGQAAVVTLSGEAGLEMGALRATLDLRRLDAEGTAGLNLLPDARQLVVIEGKLFNRLTHGGRKLG